MGQPVKLSDTLVIDARVAGETFERSIAGQVEFWANLGRALEPVLDGVHALALLRSGDQRPLSECLDSVDSPEGRQRVRAFLESQPYPHYEPADGEPGYLVRTDEQGKRTVGRFVQRRFIPRDSTDGK